MAASTRATRVFYGTVWTSRTLLAREMRRLWKLEAQDGIRRVFCVDWEQVGAENPAYHGFVQGEIFRLGADHPLVKTQYKLEEIDAEGGLFSPTRQAQMRGTHSRQHDPAPNRIYALLLDVAGSDEDAGEAGEVREREGRRDATALTIVEVDLSTVADVLIRLPTYRVVDRRLWLGVPHTALYAQVLDLVRLWQASSLVVDATGIGAGLAAFLGKALGLKEHDGMGIVVPFTFSPKSKSDLGWQFLAVIGSGRFKDYVDDGTAETRQFWYEVGACQYEVKEGPGKLLSWGVWESPRYDGLVARGHDDLLISAGMVAHLDGLVWSTGVSATIEPTDPLSEVDLEGREW